MWGIRQLIRKRKSWKKGPNEVVASGMETQATPVPKVHMLSTELRKRRRPVMTLAKEE